MKKTFLLGLGLALLFLYLFPACSSNDSVDKTSESVNSLAESKFGKNYELVYNNSGDYVICINKDEEAQPVPNQPFEFFVYDLSKSESIWKDFINLGDVEWESNYVIRVTNYPGIVKNNEDNQSKSYHLDVTKGVKIEN